MGICGTISQTVLVVFNILCLIGGIAFITVGSITVHGINTAQEDVFKDFRAAPAVLIAIGVFIFILSFFGCCGALRLNKCLLNSYIAFLVILLIAQVVLAIVILCTWKEPKDNIQKGLYEIFKKTDKASVEFFTNLQDYFKCCGVKSVIDYSTYNKPISCPSVTSSMKGCADCVTDWIVNNGIIMGWVALAFGVVEVLGIIFACGLTRSINK